MQLGMIGLGRMGANIVRRIMRDGHTAVAFDTNPDTVAEAREARARSARPRSRSSSQKLEKPRVAWVMIPAGITDKVVEQLADLMDDGDIIIDGGNSNYRDDIDRAAALKPKGIHYVDVGTSGGVWGLERGYCLMIGGEDEVGAAPRPDLRDRSRPGPATLERTPGRAGPTGAARSRATCTAARTAPATSSRWSTTASSTA